MHALPLNLCRFFLRYGFPFTFTTGKIKPFVLLSDIISRNLSLWPDNLLPVSCSSDQRPPEIGTASNWTARGHGPFFNPGWPSRNYTPNLHFPNTSRPSTAHLFLDLCPEFLQAVDVSVHRSVASDPSSLFDVEANFAESQLAWNSASCRPGCTKTGFETRMEVNSWFGHRWWREGKGRNLEFAC